MMRSGCSYRGCKQHVQLGRCEHGRCEHGRCEGLRTGGGGRVASSSGDGACVGMVDMPEPGCMVPRMDPLSSAAGVAAPAGVAQGEAARGDGVLGAVERRMSGACRGCDRVLGQGG